MRGLYIYNVLSSCIVINDFALSAHRQSTKTSLYRLVNQGIMLHLEATLTGIFQIQHYPLQDYLLLVRGDVKKGARVI